MSPLITVEEACEIVTDGTHYTPKKIQVMEFRS